MGPGSLRKADQFRNPAGFGRVQPRRQDPLLVVRDHHAKVMDQGIGVTVDRVLQDLRQGRSS